MHDSPVMIRQPGWPKRIGGVGFLLILLGIDLPKVQAQLEFNGGYVQTHRDGEGRPGRWAASPSRDRSDSRTPPSYFPDGGFFYPSYFPTRTPTMRSYFAGGSSGESISLSSPRKSSLEVIALPHESPVSRPESAMLIVHLPERARFWVAGKRTRSTGQTRYFRSPPLRPGRTYNYEVRAAWIEDGRWVSQTRTISVAAGVTQTIRLRSKQADSPPDIH